MIDEPRLVQYGVFRSSDKELVKTGNCLDIDLHAQAGDGEYALKGEFTKERTLPVYTPREKRRQAYPATGDQLGAIADLARALIEQGTDVPSSVKEWISKIDAVKAANPKE